MDVVLSSLLVVPAVADLLGTIVAPTAPKASASPSSSSDRFDNETTGRMEGNLLPRILQLGYRSFFVCSDRRTAMSISLDWSSPSRTDSSRNKSLRLNSILKRTGC